MSKMFQELNENCLLSICSYLDLKSQVVLASVNAELKYIVSKYYRTPRNLTFDAPMWRYFEKNEEHFDHFIESINDNITDLSIEGIEAKHFKFLEKFNAFKIRKLKFLTQEDILPPNSEYLVNFVGNLSASVEDLALIGISNQLFGALSDYRFPKLKRALILLQRIYGGAYPTEKVSVTRSMVQMFPELTYLALLTDTFNCDICLLEKVTELLLLQCLNFPAEFAWEIFSQLRLRKFVFRSQVLWSCYEDENYFREITACQTLEELHIDYHHLERLVQHLPNMLNLRILAVGPKEKCACFHSPVSFLPPLTQLYGQRMEKLSFHSTNMDIKADKYEEFINSMEHLCSLGFFYSFPKSQLLSSYARSVGAARLQEFIFLGTYRNQDLDVWMFGLLDILTYCSNLEIFDISVGSADIKFLHKALEIVSEREDRKTPLKIYCGNTSITPEHLKELTLPPMVEVTLKSRKYDHTLYKVIRCEWRI